MRTAIEECAKRGIEALTVFAFSSENWKRPTDEVSALMGLFMDALDREIADLHKNKVRVRFIGDRQSLSVRLQARIAAAEELTAANPGLKFQVAVSYGGRWDIVNAARELARRVTSGCDAARRHHRRQFLRHAAARGRAGPGLAHPHRWRAAHQQLPAVEPRLRGALFHRCTVAGIRRRPSSMPRSAFFAGRERRFGLTGGQIRGNG